ncbi:uncharacterized protein LOC120694236 [Panicum virgatum]|uniref:uncharacterized protein LOC120694236 n=1 Tax=Panicum virgatum TaxID=38727 RepID=UPI0019D6494A|nr:uncharacterized protein LOC120694236 [Panicum virgatum]
MSSPTLTLSSPLPSTLLPPAARAALPPPAEPLAVERPSSAADPPTAGLVLPSWATAPPVDPAIRRGPPAGRHNHQSRGGQIPNVASLSKCRLRLLKLERVKDYLLMEEEFVAAQERLRPQEDKAEEDRSKEASVLPPRNREMGVFELKINHLVLDCAYCQQPLRPDQIRGQAYTCAGGHIYCGACTRRHEKACISNCRLLDRTIAQMKFKCIFCDSGGEYIPYCKFFEHRCNTDVVDPKLPEQQMEFAFYGGGCIKTSLLVCSECELPLRPPIFRHISGDVLICSPCYRGDIVNYVRCSELDYLVQGIMVKCVACEEYIPFSTLASHQLRECPSKHKLQKIAPGSSARKNLCDEEETERLSTCSSCIQGKNKQKAPYEVGKMDKHIVRGDEVGNDDDSLDDNHAESG